MQALKDAANDGMILTLAAVGVLAGVTAARNAGVQLPTIPGMGGGSSNADDDWWAEDQWAGDGQWETFGQEYEAGSSNRGSRSRGGSRAKKGSRKASAYNKFVGQRIPQLSAQGYSPKQAMKVAAQEWRAQKGW